MRTEHDDISKALSTVPGPGEDLNCYLIVVVSAQSLCHLHQDLEWHPTACPHHPLVVQWPRMGGRTVKPGYLSLEALPFRVSNGYFGAWKVLHNGMCSTPQPLHVEERLSSPRCPPNPALSPIFYFLLALLQISTKNLEHFHRHLRFLVYYLLASSAISCRRLGNPCLK